MGITWNFITQIQDADVFGQGGVRILDMGSSNLYAATAADVRAFIARYNPSPRPDFGDFADRMERGSSYDPVRGGLNEAFVGEVFEAAGFYYDAIDIADGYKTTLVDLNHKPLPNHMRKSYDVVINCGTTEHILNQQNAFRTIHDATKVGGFICHQVPAIGYLDHGYFCYTGRFFFDLAGYNGYEIIECWLEGGTASEDIFSSFKSYKDVFPSLRRRIDKSSFERREIDIASLKVPTITINVVYKKVNDQPFMGTVEMSTSVGAISDTLLTSYEAQQTIPQIESPSSSGEAEEVG